MKNIYILTILLLFAHSICNGFGSAYYPDGRKITKPFKNIKELIQVCGETEYNDYSTKDRIVFFKKFTKIPIAILFWDTPKPDKIKEYIQAYSPIYRSYMYSYGYYADLKSMMKENKLTASYIRETFGADPKIIYSDDSSSYELFYKDFNCSFKYNSGSLQSVDVMNYKDQVDKHHLTILGYDVSGSDYTIGFSISLMNHDQRTIKYIYINATAYNAVNDILEKKTFKGIGPIEDGKSGSYEFSDAFYTKVGESIKINSIKIQYMNNTERIVPQTEIKYIMHHDWEEVGRTPVN